MSSVALKVAKECGVPVRIAHSHNSNQDKNLKYLIKLHYMKKIPAFATALFACGKDAGDWMFGGKQYHVMANAVEVKRYQYKPSVAEKIRNEWNISDELLVGHVGRFNPQKNHTFLIDIFYEVQKINPSARLLLVGDGDGKKEIQEKARKLGIADHIIFADVRTDVEEQMQAMDVFVFPSLYEGLPVTMVEAQAAGLPCIISDQIPEECIITTNLVTTQKLTDSPKIWAEHILGRAKNTRTDHYDEIKSHGYDIEEAAKWLQNYYIAHSGE